MKTKSKLLLAVIAAAWFAPLAQAGEELFPETYLADTLPQGVFEAEQSTTYRQGKSKGTYDLWQNRSEIEYGITDRWLASFYINTYSVEAQNDNSQAARTTFVTVPGNDDGVSGGGPATFGNYVRSASTFPIPAARYKHSDFDSFSVETIYQVMSPYTDIFGLAGYFEYTKGEHSEELEGKILVQKNFLDDRLVLAGNLVAEIEGDGYSQTGNELESEYELTGGASFRFAENWRAGAEMRNIRGYNGHTLDSDNRSYSVWYAGPVVSYTAKRWFATLGYQRQLPWAQAFDAAAALEQVGGLNYQENEANFVRLRLGVNFR